MQPTVLSICAFGHADPLNSLWATASREFHDHHLTVEGALPPWLAGGSFYKNGPAGFEQGGRKYTQPFNGFAKIHAWHFERGNNSATEVRFSAAFLNSTLHQKCLAEDTLVPQMTFGAPEPPWTVGERLKLLNSHVYNTNVNVWKVGAKMLAITDVDAFGQFDAQSLRSSDFTWPPCPGGPPPMSKLPVFTCAHPHLLVDDSRQMVNYEIHYQPYPMPSTLYLYAASDNLMRTVLHKSRMSLLGRVPYIHAFSITRRFAVIFFYPLYYSIGCILEGRPMGTCLYPAQGSNPGLADAPPMQC